MIIVAEQIDFKHENWVTLELYFDECYITLFVLEFFYFLLWR